MDKHLSVRRNLPPPLLAVAKRVLNAAIGHSAEVLFHAVHPSLRGERSMVS